MASSVSISNAEGNEAPTSGRDRDGLMQLFRDVSRIPSFKGGVVRPLSASWMTEATSGSRSASVSAVFEYLDVENNTKVSVEKQYTASCLSTDAGWATHALGGPPTVVDAKALGYTSPSGKRKFTVGPSGSPEDLVVSLFDSTGLVKRIPVLKAHGVLMTSPFFQNVSWNASETQVVYVAERVISPTPGKVWAVSDKTSPAASNSGNSAFEAKFNFGEAMKDLSNLSVFLCDFSEDDPKAAHQVREIVSAEFATDHWLSGPTFVDDRSVWFNATPYFPERLGLAHCPTRPNALYEVDVTAQGGGGVPVRIPYPSSGAVECTRNLRVRGGTVVCLVPATGCRAHSCCFGLWTIDVATKAFQCVVPVVALPAPRNGEDLPFPGFYCCTGSDVHWLHDGTVLVQSPRRSSCVVYVVQLHTGCVAQLRCCTQPLPGSQSPLVGNWGIADCRDGLVLLSHATAIDPPTLWLWDSATDAVVVVDASLRALTDAAQRKALPVSMGHDASTRLALTSSIVALPDHHDAEALFHRHCRVDDDASGAANVAVAPRATILFAHGGPHGSDSNAFSATTIYFQLLCGFDVLSVNYGGSTGFGQQRIDELLGHVGTNDVGDCIAALDAIAPHVATGRVVVSGGSHGGFLAAHLSGQYPDRFQVALLRNPVINMASLFWESDINDWCLAECGISAPDVGVFYALSPIQYAAKVTAATMVGIGLDDLRVPMPQGRAWYHAIRRGSAQLPQDERPTVRLLEYPSTGHAMDSPQAVADFQIHAALFVLANTQ